MKYITYTDTLTGVYTFVIFPDAIKIDSDILNMGK